jgi:hypothetical protein
VNGSGASVLQWHRRQTDQLKVEVRPGNISGFIGRAPAARQAPAASAGTQPRQSGMGIASLVIGLISLLNAILVLTVGVAIARSFTPTFDELIPINYVMGWWLYGTGVMSLVGIVFGIGGLRQKNRRVHLALAGLALNIILPMGMMFLLVLGATLTDSRSGAASRGPLDTYDPAAWHSPASRLSRWALLAMIVAVAAYYRNKSVARRKSAKVPPAIPASDSIKICPNCRKSLPPSVGFCRRCGATVAPAN